MRRAGAPARQASFGLVLAHGRGGGAEDMLRLFGQLGLPDVAVVAPEAPGNSWWPTSFLAPSAVLAPHLAAALGAVRDAVAALVEDGLAPGRIWLAGFSQGACLALEAYARDETGLAGAFGLSGGLVGTSDAGETAQADLYGNRPKAFDYQGRKDGGRVWLSVHQRDPHIPLRRVEDSAAVFRGLEAKVRVQVYPGAGHAVMREDAAALRGWLNGPA